ncbi:hypothetical protein [Undibacterium umbellatum]|uniref:hypothetical protein n=1 Tax=Undibacterium umbellatum TaxID=2762300 RepID=UPI003BB7379F
MRAFPSGLSILAGDFFIATRKPSPAICPPPAIQNCGPELLPRVQQDWFACYWAFDVNKKFFDVIDDVPAMRWAELQPTFVTLLQVVVMAFDG